MKPQTTLSIKEAAESLGVTYFVAYNAVKNGTLRGFQLGRKIRVLRADVDRLLHCGTGSDASAAAGE